MEDLRLYKSINKITRNATEYYEEMEAVGVEATPASSVEVLAGKVVKFLLTRKGTDAFYPDYGGIALHHGQICDAYIPKLRIEMLDDIERCSDYILSGESQLATTDTSSERLYSITLVKLEYDQLKDPGRLDVYIEITSTSGKKEVVAITNNTDS